MWQIWKLLIGAKPTLDDLQNIDEYTHKYLESMRACEDVSNQDEFEAKFYRDGPVRFVINGSDAK